MFRQNNFIFDSHREIKDSSAEAEKKDLAAQRSYRGGRNPIIMKATARASSLSSLGTTKI
jgi:hypothetical protein